MASARLRAGYAYGNLLGYATGGLAYLNADFEDVNHSDKIDVSAFGGVVGGGDRMGIPARSDVQGRRSRAAVVRIAV